MINTIKRLILLFGIFISLSTSAQIVLEFCPVTKIQASKDWGATVTIRNNTGVVLDLANNDFQMEWPSLVALQWPFSNGSQSGINWSFRINLDWPGTLAVGASASKSVSGNKFSGVLQFPTEGIYTQDGIDYTVTVNHCNQTNPYELYDAKVEFDRNCFLYSPTSGLCLGEAATEVWQGEGVYDVMVPTDRPSWAIATMVAHRLFTNMAGYEMLSPNFWTATALNESRMTCDNTIVPNRQNHCYINSGVSACQADGIGNIGGTTNNNCFQILNIGYTQIENNQPDLFAQTNAYGTASYSTVVDGGLWETAAIAVAYYHYQDIRYWNQIYCWNTNQFAKDATDPYAVEKVFYHAYHDGPNAGIQLLNDIEADYANAVAATNMNDVIGGTGTWASLNTGSQKVGNFTSLLDGNGVIYPTTKTDYTTEYYGCYSEDIQWSDITYYLDRVKILYPQLVDPTVEAEIQAVFDGINGGGNVPFSNLGPVIDEIVIQMGGHDPSSYIATQYGASKTCGENPVGVALRTNDTLCPGESGYLQVWLAGDPDFRVDIKFPDGSTNSYTGITSSPYNIPITQPGDYEVVYFEDADEIGDINCNFAAITVESKNDAIIGWDKTNVDPILQCASGDLIINKQGDNGVTVSYTLDGASQSDIILGTGDLSQTIVSSPSGGEYIITTMSPNACGTPINDTIEFCTTSTCTKPAYSILTPDTSICQGDAANVRVEFNGTAPYTVYYTVSGFPQQSESGILTDNISIPINTSVTVQIDSIVDATCTNDTAKSITVTVNSLPTVNLGNDTSICTGSTLTLDAQNSGSSYLWSTTEATQTIDVTAANTYSVTVTDGNGCSDGDDIIVSINSLPTVSLGNDTSICTGSTLTLDAQNIGSTYLWSTTETSQTIEISSANTYSVTVTDGNGCTGTDDIIVSISSSPAVNLGNDTTICGTINLTLDAENAGASYNWNTTESSQTINVTSAGTYAVEVTNANSCSTQDTIVVTSASDLDVNIGNDTLICGNINITLDAEFSGSTYLWNTTDIGQTINVTAAGTYAVEVTSTAGCTGQDTIIITSGVQPIVDLGNDTTLCPGADLNLDADNIGSTFLWSTTEIAQDIIVNSTGSYSVEVTNSDGCVGRDTITITDGIAPIVNLGADTSFCGTISLTLDADNAGSTYLWSTTESSQSITVNTAATYFVDVTSTDGCLDQDTIIVSTVSPPVVSLGDDTTICDGTSLTLDPGLSGYSYLWSTSETTPAISVNSANTYSVTVSAGGCSDTDEIIVSVQSAPIVNLGADNAICDGDSITLDAGNPGLNHVWSTGETSQTIVVKNSNTYTVTVTDANSCQGTDDFELTINSLPVITISVASDVCSQDGLVPVTTTPTGGMLSGNGISGSQFNPLDGTITPDIPTTIYYSYTDGQGCSSIDSNYITVHSEPSASQATGDTTICNAGSVQLDVSSLSATSFNWYMVGNGASQGTGSSLLATNAGQYFAEVSGSWCSSYSDTVTVSVTTPLVTAESNPSTPITNGESATLYVTNASGSYTYSWENLTTGGISSGSSIVTTPASTTIYEVTGQIGGCFATTFVTVVVEADVVVPNAFTPNNDTENDVWEIEGLEAYPAVVVQIFNRWGSPVYKSIGEYTPWNGMRNGDIMPTATYYYIIELNDSRERVLKGSLTLVR